jgi:hypothetical protein
MDNLLKNIFVGIISIALIVGLGWAIVGRTIWLDVNKYCQQHGFDGWNIKHKQCFNLED